MKTRSFAGSPDACPTGIACPRCGHKHAKCTDSRPNDAATKRRRRRECLTCGYRFSTIEVVFGTEHLVRNIDSLKAHIMAEATTALKDILDRALR